MELLLQLHAHASMQCLPGVAWHRIKYTAQPFMHGIGLETCCTVFALVVQLAS